MFFFLSKWYAMHWMILEKVRIYRTMKPLTRKNGWHILWFTMTEIIHSLQIQFSKNQTYQMEKQKKHMHHPYGWKTMEEKSDTKYNTANRFAKIQIMTNCYTVNIGLKIIIYIYVPVFFKNLNINEFDNGTIKLE